ncbi:MAG: molecular chaperone HtpG [Parachlamydiales bacterium]|nr:molecular chaperone HtpG [Parachlamydiales bacterium]
MRQNTLSIHSENILPIIKKWLYSDKDIFLRELVSNACDALNKVRIVLGDEGEFKISIAIDKPNQTITISDTGIGMTEDEVEKYIAQIAFSGAEEFVEKYKSQTEKDPIIGHFGLGFYSAYMVASKVEIDTRSYLPHSEPVFWSCDGSSSYTIGAGNRDARGTKITLHIDAESTEYLEESKLRELLDRHCSFMPFPIELNGKSIGNQEPLWLKSPTECTEKDYLSFYNRLFPMDPDPIFWIHLNVDYPFHLQGILYFPKLHRRFDSNESTIKLFCNRVFVSDNCKDILPDYLMILKGAIDSPDIPLNVSRSYLQVDKNVKQLSSHISKKVSDKLNLLYKNDRQKFIDSWPDIEMLVKLGILQDEKFYERVKDILIWKNSQGEWAPIDAEQKKVFYSTTENSPLLKLYKEVIFAIAPIDTAVIQFLENKLSVTFQRIDGALDESLIDPEKEKTLLDAEGKTEASRIAEFIHKTLGDVEVEAKSLASESLPALVILDENQRRFRDYIHLTQGKKGDTKKTFVVNTNHKLIQAISRLHAKQPEAAASLAKGIYDLSLLSQKEVGPEDLGPIVARQTEMLEKISALIS